MITTERLLLRPWRETDAEALFEIARDPEIGPACGWKPHTSMKESLRVLRQVLIPAGALAVADKETDAPIGSIELKGPGRSGIAGLGEGDLELGYWIARARWNEGLATEAGQTMLAEAFAKPDVQRVWASAADGNERSRRVQEKLGMAYRFSENVVVPALKDAFMVHVRCITREDYEKKRP